MGADTVRVWSRPDRTVTASLWTSVRAALPAWLLARGIMLAAVGEALRERRGMAVYGPWAGADRLEVWDVVLYQNLAEHGYLAYGPFETRFFPLLPALTGAGHALGLPTLPLLTGLCWAAALAFAAALHRLVLMETGDENAARRSAWLIQLVPGANVLVLGYTEALAGLLAVTFFIALRPGRRLATTGILGVLSGLVRPTGLLLSLPAAVELLRRRRSGRLWVRLLVVLAPISGTAGFLTFAWFGFGDFLAPYRAQTGQGLRGGVINIPYQYLFRNSPGGYHWSLVLALLVTAGFLLFLCVRHLPMAYSVWAAVNVAAAVTAAGFHSLPRYLAAAFPLVMAAALACRHRIIWLATLGVCLAGFGWVAYLTMTPGPVP